jgi:hypothetical protein
VAPVNDAPIAVDDTYSTTETTTLTVSAPGVLTNDSDIDSPTLTAVLVSGPEGDEGLTFHANGSFEYVPHGPGTVTFTYRASDGDADSPSNVATVTINVSARVSFNVTSPVDGLICGEKTAVGDVNGDGRLDIVLTDLCGTPGAYIYPGNGSGGFGAPTFLGGKTRALALGDLNGDGLLDIATADNGSGVLFLSNGDGGFNQSVVDGLYESIQIVDVNGDGRRDLVSAALSGSTVSVLLNNGEGFTAAPAITVDNFPQALVVGDLTGDGRPDLVVESVDEVGGTITVSFGNGDGTFDTMPPFVLEGLFSVPESATPMALTDINGDGKLDLAIAAQNSAGFYLYMGNGNGTFTDTTPEDVSITAESLTFADVDNDGTLDLVGIGTDGAVSLSILPGNSEGGFDAEIQIPLGTDIYGPTGLANAIGDFNGDNRPDIVIGEEEGDFLVLLNTSVAP